MNENTILRKEVFQINFRPNIKSADNFLDIAAKFEDNYDEWLRQDNNYTLYSPSNLTALLLNMNSIAFVSESDSETSITAPKPEEAFESFTQYVKEFEISEIRRIGYGSVSIRNTDWDFENMTEQLYSKFYSQEVDVFDESIDESPIDLAVIIDGNKNGYNNHIELGATRKAEAVSKFKSSFTQIGGRISSLNDVSLYTSTDIFITDPKLDEITEELVKGLFDENKRIEEAYISHLLSS